MTSSHDSQQGVARDRRASPGYRHGYAEAELAFLIGRAIRDRGLALSFRRPRSLAAPA